MGLLYIIAGMQNNRSVAIATIPLRLLTAAVFWLQSGDSMAVFVESSASNWKVTSFFEGVGGLLTGLAMVWDAYGNGSGKAQRKGKKD